MDKILIIIICVIAVILAIGVILVISIIKKSENFKFANTYKGPKGFLAVVVRCKDELYISEFCEYYLKIQGVDKVFIADDDSVEGTYDLVKDNPDVIIVENVANNTDKNPGASIVNVLKILQMIRNKFEWVLHVDADEFVCSPQGKTLPTQLKDEFSAFDCVCIPWVMMSSNGTKTNPNNILMNHTWRWSQDKHHKFNIGSKEDKVKFRCRYDKIEVKSCFRPNMVKEVNCHIPTEYSSNLSIVDSVYKKKHKKEKKDLAFYKNLREKDVRNAFLICYHYRIFSEEHVKHKISTSQIYKIIGITVEGMLASDYADLEDNTVKDFILSRPLNLKSYWTEKFR